MKKTNKLISILLVVAMLLSMAPMSLMASAALTPTATGGCDGNHSEYTAINSKKTITKAGNYYLTGNVSVTDYSYPLKIQCSGTVTLCLNGYDLYHAGNGNCVVEIIATGGDLTVNLCDCKGTGEIYHNKRKAGIYLFGDTSNGYYVTINMYGGTIRDCSSGVDESDNTRFNMYGGTIKGCSYYGVFQSKYDGKVNIYGGTITGNMEGIRVCSADAVTLTGSPVINGNTNGDLYFRNNNSPIIAKNLSVNEKITIAQYTAADCVVVKVDSEEAYDCFEALDPNARVISHNDNTIWFHGDHPWKDASCTEPKTCQTCGMTEGDPLGHDWSNLDGICANGCGLECDHENQTGEICEICGKSLHTHSFTYIASDNMISSTCIAAGCDLENYGGTLTISPPADLFADGTAKEATVENNLADTSVAVNVTYSTADGSAPKTAGTYTASVTVGGATATVQFEIIKRSSTAENFIYTAPENLVYDGTPKYATVEVSPEITGMGEITVSYYQNGEAVEPINAGTYTVKVSTAETDKYYAINGVDLGSFTIEKKAVTAIATVPDKVYDGTINLDLSKVTITFDGIADGDTIEYEVLGGSYFKADAGKNINVAVSYDVIGETTDNYDFNAGMIGVPEANYSVMTKANILPKDISDAVITLGDALTYNGAGQKQTVESVTVDGLEVTYTVSGDTATNVGVYELTVTANTNFTGTKTALYTINPDLSGIEGLDQYNVKSINKADVECVYNQLDNAETDLASAEKKAEWKEIKDECWQWLKVLETVAYRVESLGNSYLAYDIDTVTSADDEALLSLEAEMYLFMRDYRDNMTEEELLKVDNARIEISKLRDRIAEIKSEYDRVIAAANGYDEATVTSADKDALVQLNEDIYALALTENVTAEEKANLEAAHDKVFGLIDKLTAISEEIKRIIETVDKYVFESVKSSDKADIQQLIADIKVLLDTQNITADERTILETADETCDKLIAKIDETVAEINRINDATNAYDESTVKYSDYTDILQLIDDIEALTDGQNITDGERASLEELNTEANLLAAKIRSTADEIARITRAVNAYNIDTVKSSDKTAIENLIARIKKLTDGDNITDAEREQLIANDETLDALLEKINATADEIARIDEAVNSYDEETVKSSDIPALGKLIDDIKALTDSDNITEDEKATLEADDEAIDELVEKLTEVAEEIKRVDEAVKSYDEDTVKLTDKEELAKLKEDVQALINSDNTTENEKTALGEMIKDIEALEGKIEATEQQLEKIAGIENSYTPETVTSDDKATIEETIAEIEAVNSDNLTDEQKAEYEEIKAGFEALLDKIEEASKTVADIGVELEMFDEKRVTIFWEDEIEALKAKIDELLTDENMGETEKAKLNEHKAQAEKLIEIINDPCAYFSMRLFYFVWDALNWLSSHVVFIFNWIF